MTADIQALNLALAAELQLIAAAVKRLGGTPVEAAESWTSRPTRWPPRQAPVCMA